MAPHEIGVEPTSRTLEFAVDPTRLPLDELWASSGEQNTIALTAGLAGQLLDAHVDDGLVPTSDRSVLGSSPADDGQGR